MKKMISIFGAFCLGLFVSVAVIACADGNNDVPPFKTIVDCDCFPTILQYQFSDDRSDPYTIKYEYDEKGRITTIELDDCYKSIYVVDYNENSIVVRNTRTQDDEAADISGGEVHTFELTKVDMNNPKATNAVIYDLGGFSL